jgi:hypothetical protein
MAQLIYDPPHQIQQPSSLGIATMYSQVYQCDRFSTIGIQVNVSNASSLTGTVAIQVTIDGVNWALYAGSTLNVTTNTSLAYSISEFAFVALRVVMTNTAGSGTYEIWTLAKQS